MTGKEKIFVGENLEFMFKKKVSNVTEISVEHGIHCLPCYYINAVIDISS